MTDHTQKTSSNLVDRPINNDSQDLLGTNIYVKALSNFIKESRMPITISIQGDWGAGKTSFLYSLQECLCDKAENIALTLNKKTDDSNSSARNSNNNQSSESINPNESDNLQALKTDNANNPHTKPFYSIYLSMWEMSTLSTPDGAIENIMTSLLKQIRGLMKDSECSSLMDKLIELPKKPIFSIISSGLKGILKLTGHEQVYETASDLIQSVWTVLANTNKEDDLIPANFRKIVSNAVQECLNNIQYSKRGFIIFIDDLDRIEPEVAVKILDILKNYFDVDNCVFILAIDYDVIVKGLQAKFNNLDDNDREIYQSYFDKIIQLPFNISTDSYQVNEYLEESLYSIGFIDKTEAQLDDIFKGKYNASLAFNEAIVEITSLSIGKNPRSIKRLLNRLSLSLYIFKAKIENSTIFDKQKRGNTSTHTAPLDSIEKIILYALVCIQISYPYMHDLLLKNPDFVKWNKDIIYNNDTTDSKVATDNKSELSDNYKDIIHYLYCKNSNNLSAIKITKILSIIEALCNSNNVILKDKLKQLLSISSVTSVSDNQKNFHYTPRQEAFWNGFQEYTNSIHDYSSFYPSFVVSDTNNIEVPITYNYYSTSFDFGKLTLIADTFESEIEIKFNIIFNELNKNCEQALIQLFTHLPGKFSFADGPLKQGILRGRMTKEIYLPYEGNWLSAYEWFSDTMCNLMKTLSPYFNEYSSSGLVLPPSPVRFN